MSNLKLIGWRANEDEIALVEAIREKTDETTVSAVLRKAVIHYAKAKRCEA